MIKFDLDEQPSLYDDRPDEQEPEQLVAYKDTREAMLDAGHKEKDFG